MSHNELAAQIVRQARVIATDGGRRVRHRLFAPWASRTTPPTTSRKDFEQSGALGRTVMFLNMASDPIIERVLTPRCAMTAAEYLAFTLGYHVLVIMTDMTSYARPCASSPSKGEIPSRKGFPSYLYSGPRLHLRAGGAHTGKPGSVTQVPILTMPNDDITHPVPDLTGYITEGRSSSPASWRRRASTRPSASCSQPPSRLMKDGTGEGLHPRRPP